MKKSSSLRFLATITVVKIATKILKLMGKNATHLPGWLANKMCPDFLGHLEKPEKLVFITGTNGKTTVSNLTANVLSDSGYDFINNSSGSNVSEGVISALLSKSSFFGKANCKLAVLEVDERYAPLIYPYMEPDYVLCTNLFRDSYKRNAHSEFISGILNQHIPAHTKMILNGEDLISNHLAWGNDRCYFGIGCPDGHSTPNNIIKDIVSCPDCGAKLDFEYIRYNHIGRAHCPNCEFGSPEMDYVITDINYDSGRCEIQTPEGVFDFKLLGNNVTDLYNEIAAVALLSELGVDISKTKESFEKLKVTESRFNSIKVGEKEIVMNLAKGQNPIACSRVCDFIRHETGNKTVLMMFDDIYDAKDSSENMAWIYDIDFEFLNDESVKQIVIAGVRHQDYHLRLLLAGIPEEKITCCEKESDISKYVDTDQSEKFYLIYDLFLFEQAKQTSAELKERLEKGGKEA